LARLSLACVRFKSLLPLSLGWLTELVVFLDPQQFRFRIERFLQTPDIVMLQSIELMLHGLPNGVLFGVLPARRNRSEPGRHDYNNYHCRFFHKFSYTRAIRWSSS